MTSLLEISCVKEVNECNLKVSVASLSHHQLSSALHIQVDDDLTEVPSESPNP